MPFQAILREVDQLQNVSTRLEALAERYPPLSEPLTTIAVSVRNGLFPRQLLSFQRVVREGWRVGLARDQPTQTLSQKSSRRARRKGGAGDRPGQAGFRPGAGGQRTHSRRPVCLPDRGAQRLAAARSGNLS